MKSGLWEPLVVWPALPDGLTGAAGVLRDWAVHAVTGWCLGCQLPGPGDLDTEMSPGHSSLAAHVSPAVIFLPGAQLPHL